MTPTHDGLTDQERRARMHRLLQHIILSMVVDSGKAKTKDLARKDLTEFRDWDIFVKAQDCGMDLPSVAQVERYLEEGMADKKTRILMRTNSADLVRK